MTASRAAGGRPLPPLPAAPFRRALEPFVFAASASGQRLYLSGGALRDLLLGAGPRRELDLTVADPRRLLAVLRLPRGASVFVLDEARDTFRAVLPAGSAAAHVDLARLRAPTIEEDLALRDFTVNAAALEIGAAWAARRLIDPVGAAGDCRRRLLRACGPRSVADDPLRALRGVRFAAALGLRIEPATLRLMARARRGLRRVSRERVRDELFRILEGPRPLFGATLALRLHLLEGVGIAAARRRLGRLARVELVLTGIPVRSRIRAALAEPLEQGVTRLGVLRLAAVLRDTGRAPRAGNVCLRLKLGARAAKVCTAAAGTAPIPRAWYRRAADVPRAQLRGFWVGRDAAALEAILLDAPSAAPALKLAARYSSARRIFIRPPLLDGASAMRELGLAPGPALGALLATAKRAQDLGRFRTKTGALRWTRAHGDSKAGLPEGWRDREDPVGAELVASTDGGPQRQDPGGRRPGTRGPDRKGS